MLSREQIEDNKIEFIKLLRSIERPGAKIEELITKLETSDFFTAPASTKYHNAFEGGLCDHCLNVYYNMMHLFNYKMETIVPDLNEEVISKWKESIIIVSLLHDFSKMNFYKLSSRNQKVYCVDGDKYDELGKFRWETVLAYTVKDIKDRFMYGSHEMTSEYMARQFIPLTLEESVAISHHACGMENDSAQDRVGDLCHRFSLLTLLHLADMLGCFVDERVTYE